MIGEIIREMRCNMAQSQKELGLAIGVSATQLGEIERGRSIPSPRTTKLIASYLRLPKIWVDAWLQDEPRLSTRIRLMELLIDAHQFVEARIILRKAWFQDAHQYECRYRHKLCHLAGQLAYHQGRYLVAIRWFSRMGRRLPHATAKTRGIAAYDRGMALLRVQRLSEAYHWISVAYDHFASDGHRSMLTGYALWGMATCLFDGHHYPQALKRFQESIEAFPHDKTPSAVQLGFTLCRWIVRPSPETETALVNFIVPLQDSLVFPYWCLAVAVLHRQQGDVDAALKILSRIPSDIPMDMFCDLRAEQALCYWELGEMDVAWRHIKDLDDAHIWANDALRLFRWAMENVLGQSSPFVVPPCSEGYERRLSRLRETAMAPRALIEPKPTARFN